MLAVGTIFLLLGKAATKSQRFDDRITLKKTDKIPYGSYIAFVNLKWIFPHAEIIVNKSFPGEGGWFKNKKNRKVLMVISPQFLADEDEMLDLIDFAHRGNDVFISTRRLSLSAMEAFKTKSSFSFDAIDKEDSLKLTLRKPAFRQNISAIYPGQKFDTYLYQVDSVITQVLSKDEEGDPNFVRFQTGKGSIYLHLAPLAFSNYFILHKQNKDYYDEVLSILSPGTKVIIWDEYYLHKQWGNNKESEQGWLGVLLKYPELKAGLLTAVIALLVYVIMESRRKQRLIPVIPAKQNDSLEFIKTIGRLYHEKGDHKNLAHKMSQYFLDHVRNNFFIRTETLDDEFVKMLHQKTGYHAYQIKDLTEFIIFIDTSPAISEKQLAQFHQQLEKFYKNT